MSHRSVALATALAQPVALLSPVSAVPVQAKPDTILGLRPVARGAMFPFERPAELLFTRTADLGEVMFGFDDAGTLDR